MLGSNTEKEEEEQEVEESVGMRAHTHTHTKARVSKRLTQTHIVTHANCLFIIWSNDRKPD